jgi:hypothetical protein
MQCKPDYHASLTKRRLLPLLHQSSSSLTHSPRNHNLAGSVDFGADEDNEKEDLSALEIQRLRSPRVF